MKILKSRISKSVLIAAYYITLVVIFRTPVLSDLSIETIKTNLFDVSTLVPVFLVGVSYVILSQLYLLHFWSVVLIILAIIGTGIEKPLHFVLHSQTLAIPGPMVTLLAVIVFWLFELLAGKYFGTDWFAKINGDSFMDDEEMIKLNLSSGIKQENCMTVKSEIAKTDSSFTNGSTKVVSNL